MYTKQFESTVIIIWAGGNDEAHHRMLQDKQLWYKDYNEVYGYLTNLDWFRTRSTGIYKELVKEYNPTNVMEKFDQVFLSKII